MMGPYKIFVGDYYIEFMHDPESDSLKFIWITKEGAPFALSLCELWELERKILKYKNISGIWYYGSI